MRLLHAEKHVGTRNDHGPGHPIEGGFDGREVDGKPDENRSDGVSEVAPHPVEAKPGGSPEGMGRVAGDRDQVGVVQRHAHAREARKKNPESIPLDQDHAQDSCPGEKKPAENGGLAANLVPEATGLDPQKIGPAVHANHDFDLGGSQALGRKKDGSERLPAQTRGSAGRATTCHSHI